MIRYLRAQEPRFGPSRWSSGRHLLRHSSRTGAEIIATRGQCCRRQREALRYALAKMIAFSIPRSATKEESWGQYAESFQGQSYM
uniref:Uncharacterized protein n=1 Tax=Sphaerodactylus townsendi TaxID=933632 RepID=A0ACB8ELF7_9SAUR